MIELTYLQSFFAAIALMVAGSCLGVAGLSIFIGAKKCGAA